MTNFTREKCLRLAAWLDRTAKSMHPRDGLTFMTGLEPLVISLIVSAAFTAGSMLISYLTAPRPPRAQPKGHQTGETTVSDSIWGFILPRIHGKRRSDGIGGVEVGANVFFASELRTTYTNAIGTPAGQGKMGGGSPPQAPPQQIPHMHCDFAAAVGVGRLRLLRLKANEDVLYDITGGVQIPQPYGATYEAETATIGGDALTSSVVGFQPAYPAANAVQMNDFGSVEWSNVSGAPANTVYTIIELFYKTLEDVTIQIEVNGAVSMMTLARNTTRGMRQIAADLPLTLNTIKISTSSDAGLRLDCISVWFEIDDGGGTNYLALSGVLDHAVLEAPEVENDFLPANDRRDLMAINRANAASPELDPEDVLIVPLASGGQLAFYPGSETQPVDPVIAAWVATLKGDVRYTPAFLGTAYMRLSDFEITKWGSFPNIRCVCENMDTGTVEEILLAEAAFSGLDADDFDLSAAAGKEVRGYLALNSAAPEKTFQDMAMLHHLSFCESTDGVIKAIDRNDKTPVFELTEEDLGAYAANDETATPDSQDFVVTELPDEVDQARTLEVQFFNPLRPSSFGTDRREDVNPFTSSTKKETITLAATMLPDEAERMVKRVNQERWHKLAPHKFNLTTKWAWIDSGDVGTVPIDGRTRLVRVEHKVGAAPGVIEFQAVPENIYVTAETNHEVEYDRTKMARHDVVEVPTFTIGTLFDLQEPLTSAVKFMPGLYAAAHPSRSASKWRGATLHRYKAGGWQIMATFKKPCIMGKVVTAFSDDPGLTEFDDASTLTVDIYGDFTPDTLLDAFTREGGNPALVGDEVIYVGEWTRDSGFVNRWVGTHILRGKNSTLTGGHLAGERFVMLTDGLKHLPMEPDEIGCEYQWKFVTNGQSIDHASIITFAWGGQSNRDRVIAATDQLKLHAGLQGRRMTNVDATALIEIELPPAVRDDDDFSLVITDASGIRLKATGTARIHYGELMSIVGGYVESTVVGSTLTVVGLQGNWYVNRSTGIWEVQTS